MLGEASLLEKLNEHGEIKAGTMAEAREAYKVETWARKIGITRQVLVNDDLGAFSDLARRMGQAAAETEAEKWLASVAPAKAADVNPFSGSLTLVVEPRLSSATRWYVTADPGEIDGLE